MFIIITTVVLPVLFMYVFTRNVYRFRQRNFSLKFGALYKRIRFNNKPQMFYYGLFIWRRIFYVLLICEAMYFEPVYQVISLVLINFGQMIYFTQVYPKSGMKLNWLEIFNES